MLKDRHQIPRLSTPRSACSLCVDNLAEAAAGHSLCNSCQMMPKSHGGKILLVQ